MPSSNPLSNLFGRSPIGPIQEHMQVACEAVRHLPAFMQAAADADWKLANELNRAVNKAEKEADKLKRSVRRHLPKSLFLPVPRSDLLALIGIQDQVANTAKDICGIVLSRDLRFPDAIFPATLEFTQTCVATVEQALNAIQELDELLEVGFSGREVKLVESMLKELHRLERQTDKQQFNLRRALYRIEDECKPVDVMFYYRTIAAIGKVADTAENVGNHLQILLAK
ncbi:TIGR00153 family protein [Haliea sp. E17]|uniref:TIGR00153 family protein n=1 Tax=Haliea sp. E17 TaxID=3401576 RepID=UPI003AAF4689